MKKILFYTLLFCLASVGFTSCSDDEELTDSKITYYPEMEIQGDKFTILPIGTVAVCDPSITTNIEGKYKVQSGSYRDNGSAQEEYAKYSVTIEKAAPGLFYISDFFGGYYDQGRGYGSTTAMTGYIQLMADNSIKLLSSYVSNWGDSLDSFENGKYDPATGEISFDAAYAGQMTFHVILK